MKIRKIRYVGNTWGSWFNTALVALCALALSACAHFPLVSDAENWDNSTLEEQRTWVEVEVDGALEAIGQQEGWVHAVSRWPWDESKGEILQNVGSETCRPSQGGFQPARLTMRLGNYELASPFDAAARLKQHWADSGWEVAYVTDPNEGSIRIEYFRADHVSGAILSFSASERYSLLTVSSPCSEHDTVRYR